MFTIISHQYNKVDMSSLAGEGNLHIIASQAQYDFHNLKVKPHGVYIIHLLLSHKMSKPYQLSVI